MAHRTGREFVAPSLDVTGHGRNSGIVRQRLDKSDDIVYRGVRDQGIRHARHLLPVDVVFMGAAQSVLIILDLASQIPGFLPRQFRCIQLLITLALETVAGGTDVLVKALALRRVAPCPFGALVDIPVGLMLPAGHEQGQPLQGLVRDHFRCESMRLGPDELCDGFGVVPDA